MPSDPSAGAWAEAEAEALADVGSKGGGPSTRLEALSLPKGFGEFAEARIGATAVKPRGST